MFQDTALEAGVDPVLEQRTCDCLFKDGSGRVEGGQP